MYTLKMDSTLLKHVDFEIRGLCVEISSEICIHVSKQEKAWLTKYL